MMTLALLAAAAAVSAAAVAGSGAGDGCLSCWHVRKKKHTETKQLFWSCV